MRFKNNKMAFQFSSLTLYLLASLSLINHGNSFSFLNVYPRLNTSDVSSDAGEPLMLTPYLRNGTIKTAQKLSRVSITENMGFRSHAGFFTVDANSKSNHYFWYFPPFSKRKNAPVILWLQGGPGGTSLFGLFTENGPLVATKKGLALRKYHWALDHHLLFIDNPVGAGFSFTDTDDGYCKNEQCIATSLYNSVHQFFLLFPYLRNNDFYITGESYAGKYIPSLGMHIHRMNTDTVHNYPKINLKGMAIGNGYCDPVNQLDYGNYLYQHGLLDDNGLKIFLKYQKQIALEIKNNNFLEADILMEQLMDGTIYNDSLFRSLTGLDNAYNFLEAKSDIDVTVFENLLENVTVRRSIHVGNRTFNDGELVALNLAFDMLKSVAPVISKLLDHYRIVFYNGQLDIIVAYPLTENFLGKLTFSASEEYKKAPRQIWRVGRDIAGYVKTAGNLTEILVRDAGHMVPSDQPVWTLDLIKKYLTKV